MRAGSDTAAGGGESRPRRYSRLSLATVLALGLGGLMLLGVGSVLAVSFGGATKNTNELLRDKADLILSSIEQRIRQHLDAVATQADYLKALIERGQLDPSDDAALAAALRAALAATPQVIGIGFITPDSQVVRVERDGGASIREDWSQRPEITGVIDGFRKNRQTGWAEPVWSEPFRQTIVPLSAPIYRGEELIGLLVPALLTSELSRYLAAFSSATQTPFILLGQDQVVAHPLQVGTDPKGSRERPLPRLDEIGDPVLAAIWSPERRTLRLGLAPGDRGHTVAFDDDYSIFIYRQIAGYGPKPWIVGAVMPGEVAGREVERLMRVAAVGVALLLLAVGTAVVAGRGLAYPIRDLVAVTEHVQRLDFARVPSLPRSRVRELDGAGQALNAMVSALRWFELYVPRRLVHRLLAQGGGHALPDAVERDLTVMFTDMVGFSRLASRLPPSETAGLLNEHFALIGACVEAEEGTIDKYIGDSVMAFWGAPDEQPDHAERACRAAAAIARRIAEDNARRREAGLEPIRARIGISTGRALVGNIGAPGRVNYTLVGDAVNLAQRLEQLGKEFENEGDVVVLMTEASHACLRDHAAAELIGRREVRNRDGLVGIYKLA